MKLKWVENKRVLKSFILLILIISTIFIINSCAFAFGGEGHFEKVDYGNKPFYSAEPVKIKSGKVIFPPNHIFDPKTNKVTEVKDKTFFDGILLEDGRIFHAEAEIQHPCENLHIKRNIIYKVLDDNKVELPNGYNSTPWGVKDKEKFFLPYLKKNPELYKEYKEAIDSYEKSMYGIISDPETGKYEYTKGKMNVRRNDAYKFLLDDGKIVLIGGRKTDKEGYMVSDFGQIEIFDLKTGIFNLVKNYEILGIKDAIKINNEKIMIIGYWYQPFYYMYNPKTNTLSEKKPFLKDWNVFYWVIVRLNDGNLLFTARPKNNEAISKIENGEKFNWKKTLNSILIFNTNTEEYKFAGHFVENRWFDANVPFYSVLLKDGKILTFGGTSSTDFFGRNNFLNSAEIFDPKTGISRKAGNMNYENIKSKGIMLNDGRVLSFRYPNVYRDKGSIYRNVDNFELYIPKSYRK